LAQRGGGWRIFRRPAQFGIDIVQATGRALRIVPGKSRAYVIIPVLVREEEDAETNEAPRSKLRGITELNFEDFSEVEANPVASYGECSSSNKPV
jgi:hypothetical protein